MKTAIDPGVKDESMKVTKLLQKVLLLVSLLFTVSTFGLADDKPERPLITVTGEAEVNIAPDEVVFDLTVQTINKDLRLAKSQTDERLKSCLS